ncbi:MAG: hypothetical protein Q9208_008085 [Pyrenodesmia sp. 3 TL-2023]
MASFTRLTLTTAVCVCAVWFWYHGRYGLNPSKCPAQIFFFAKASIYGGVGTLLKIQSTLLLIAVGGFFVWQSVEISQSLIARTCSKVARELKMDISRSISDDERDEKTGLSSSSERMLEKLGACGYGIGGLRYFAHPKTSRMFSQRSRLIVSVSSKATKILSSSIDMESSTNGKISENRLDLTRSLSVWHHMLE